MPGPVAPVSASAPQKTSAVVWILGGCGGLVVLAALGCGLVWGLVVARTGRLPVAIVSHVLFTWGVVLQFPLWRLT